MSRSGDLPPIRRYRSRNSSTSSSLVGRPPRMSRRKGPTSSSEFGPPTAVKRTAVGRPSIFATPASSRPSSRFVHETHEGAQLLLSRLWKDSVAQVEDMAGTVSDSAQDVLRGGPPCIGRSKEGCRVEIPLDALIIANPPPCRVDRDPPIDADHVPSSRREGFEDPRGPGAERDARAPRLADFIEQAARERGHARVVVPRAQCTGPTVEDLEGLSAGIDLSPEVRRGPADEELHQRPPLHGMVLKEEFRRGEILRRTARDHIARHRERRAGEPNARSGRGRPRPS